MVNYKRSSSCLLSAVAISCFVLPALCASIDSNATCYFPNGSVHILGSPCRPAAGDGACCESTHACLSNGLCFDTQNNHVARLSCTDKTWSNSNCPNFCNNFASASIADLRQCDKTNANWVCGQNVSLCTDSGTAKFSVPTGLISDARSNLTQAIVQVQAAGTATSADGTATVTTTATATVTVGSSSATGSDLKTTAINTGTQAAIGAGVGVPLLLALIGAIYLYMRERKLRMAMMSQMLQMGQGPLPPPPNGVPQTYSGPASEYNSYNNIPQTMKTPAYQSNAYQPPQTHELMSERRSELS